MTSMQDFIDRSVEIADRAGQKGLELCEMARINVKISEISFQTRKLYAQLGKMTYNVLCGDTDEFTSEMKAVKEEIDNNLYRVKLLRNELAQVKGVIVCDSCGEENKKNSAFCSKCGKEL